MTNVCRRQLLAGFVVYAAGDPFMVSELDGYREAARRLGMTLVERPVHNQAEAQAALGSVQKTEVGAILSPRYLSLNIPGFIVETGLREKIPTMLHASFHVEQGGLASYAADLYQLGRQAARLVERIMKGAKPADIPVERTTRFELVVNRKTATTLGLRIPPEIGLRVDRFIE
jgi:putative ABC transport system substrate-binding protein